MQLITDILLFMAALFITNIGAGAAAFFGQHKRPLRALFLVFFVH